MRTRLEIEDQIRMRLAGELRRRLVDRSPEACKHNVADIVADIVDDQKTLLGGEPNPSYNVLSRSSCHPLRLCVLTIDTDTVICDDPQNSRVCASFAPRLSHSDIYEQFLTDIDVRHLPTDLKALLWVLDSYTLPYYFRFWSWILVAIYTLFGCVRKTKAPDEIPPHLIPLLEDFSLEDSD